MWWKDENCPRLNKLLERLGNTTVYGVCDEGDLKLGEDPVLQMIVFNGLKRISSKLIT